MDYDVFLYILVELIVTILTSPRLSKTESECESYARFHFALSAVFRRGGSSGRCPGSSGPVFPWFFRLSLFSCFSLEGFRKFAPEVSPENSEGPEILVLGPEVPVREILAKSCVFSLEGVRNFDPEVFPRNFRGPEVPALNPGSSVLPWL